MRILLLNWRDPLHPRAGGAEVLTHGIFSRLVARGHRVVRFGGSFEGGAATGTLDGVDIVRGGNSLTVRAHAYRYYRDTYREFDAVVDEINTLPFLTPLYARCPQVAFVHQLAREVWYYEAPRPIADIGYAIEPFYMRPYRRVPTLTVSNSSAASLRSELGFTGEIGVMPMAIDQWDSGEPLPLAQRDDTIVALGRITPSKRLDQAIRALALLREPPLDRLRLQIIGGGDRRVRDALAAIAESLGVASRVEWIGFADEPRKRDLLRRSKALVMTSVREGWGLAVSEANLAGTPALGYDVYGLRDSIKSGQTGFLTEESPEALAKALTRLLDSSAEYGRLAATARQFATTLSWDATASFVESFLQRITKAT